MSFYKTSSLKNTVRIIPFTFCLFICFLLFTLPMAFGASLSLSWNPNGEADLDGYNIHYGTSSGSYGEPLDVGNVTFFELSGLDEGTRYYIALTAYDTARNESEKSIEKNGVARVITSSTTTTITTSTAIEMENTSHYTGIVEIAEEEQYYIDIPNDQSYLFVELKGNPDADLYVRYGSPATIAQWDCRPYTEDSSNENCSFSYPDSGRWYIMVRGYSGTVDYDIMAMYGTGSPPVTTTTIPPTTTIPGNDTTPPSGTVIINNGLVVSYSLNVILILSAIDDGEELKKNGWMTFSNDNQEWSDPEPYTTAKLWTLSPGQGTKTVYVKFRDAAGNWMTTPAQDQIIYEASENACDQPEKLMARAPSASSQLLPFFSKENAVDGNPSTTWSTLLSIFNKDEFITLDLGALKRISWLSMEPASTMFGTDYFPVNFKIEISRDTMFWEEISTEQGYVPPIQDSHSDSWDFRSRECRYIRVYISKRKTIFFFFKVAQIAEIEVYGCDSTSGQLPTFTLEDRSINDERAEVGLAELEQEESNKDYGGKPSIPGKPVVTFYE